MSEATYWANKGRYQDLANALNRLVPVEGEIKGKDNKALEKFRRASNAYYDIFNNGGCNRAAQIRAIFGFGISRYRYNHRFDWDGIHKQTEPVMDQIILAAAAEQLAKLPSAGRIA